MDKEYRCTKEGRAVPEKKVCIGYSEYLGPGRREIEIDLMKTFLCTKLEQICRSIDLVL